MKRLLFLLSLGTLLVIFGCQNPHEPGVDTQNDISLAKPGARGGGINILLNEDINSQILATLEDYGKVTGTIPEIRAVFLNGPPKNLTEIQQLPFVLEANPDVIREAPPAPQVLVSDFGDGLNTWNLDAINVTDPGFANRQVAQDGSGVYVGVLDSGLLPSWRSYFPDERIAVEYAKSFGGGGALAAGNVSEQPNKWEHDTNAHGTHVTSTILGYSLEGTPINGVAPMANVIPVKVLNQNGSGWSSVIAQGITYMANLKTGPLAGSPVVINMSLGGSRLDAVEKAAVDYAVAQGVIIVSSAGNGGENGMSYPAAYEPVISVAASGWMYEWYPTGNSAWWYNLDVPELTGSDYSEMFYITDFSARALSGQDLDVVAPGSWVVGPYQLNMGQLGYYFLGGTSMASPHVAGIVALMVEKNNGLAAADAESILEGSAIPLAAGSRDVLDPAGNTITYSWDANATGAGLVDVGGALDGTP